jgi:hypothetical protein
MQRWEYLIVKIEQDNNLIDFIELPSKTLWGDDVKIYLDDKIGIHGWELVNVSTREHDGQYIQRLWFKRPVADN